MGKLRDYELIRQGVTLPLGFGIPSTPQLCASWYPRRSTAEGQEKYREIRALERSSVLSRDAKDKNRAEHHGLVTCEACGLSDQEAALFDAHHLYPLCKGPRESDINDFAILCPTCHRWAHHKTDDPLQPLSVAPR
jgi:5-methylcytosine-specific restriction protein A